MPEYHQPSAPNQSLAEPETIDGSRATAAPARGGAPPRSDAPRTGAPGGLGSAIRRHPILAIFPVLVLLAAGVVAGMKKHPTYSASATINVGKANIITQATPGYVQAAEVLAGTYSEVVMSQHVSAPVARELGESQIAVSKALTAVPVSSEPTFTITGTGRSPQSAISLTNAAVSQIVKYSNGAQTQQGSPSQLLGQYVSAQSRADTLNSKAGSLQGRLSAGVGHVTHAQVTRAKVAGQVAQLQANAYGSAYQSLLQNGPAPSLEVLSTAMTATSNRNSNVEKYGIVGLAAGVVVGVSLAGLAGGIEARRRVTRPA